MSLMSSESRLHSFTPEEVVSGVKASPLEAAVGTFGSYRLTPRLTPIGGIHETRYPAPMKMPSVALISFVDRQNLPQIRRLRKAVRTVISTGMSLS